MAMHLCRNVCARLRGIARPGPVAAVAPQGARSFFSSSYLASEGFKEKYINGYMWVLAFLFGITVLKVKKGHKRRKELLKAMKEDMKSMRTKAGTTYAEIMEAYERDKQRFRG
ncbi:hypothetical protein OROGR_012744 [Orobanche gracilis]